MSNSRKSVSKSLLDRIADTVESAGADVDQFLFPAKAPRLVPVFEPSRHADIEEAEPDVAETDAANELPPEDETKGGLSDDEAAEDEITSDAEDAPAVTDLAVTDQDAAPADVAPQAASPVPAIAAGPVPALVKPAPGNFPLFAPKVTREDLAAILAGGKRLTRQAAVAALGARGVKQTTAYRALREDGRFAGLLTVGEDGLLAFKG
jgi:hypothetical protein